MSDEERSSDEIRALCEAATPGPWFARTTGRSGGDHWHVCEEGQSIALVHASDGEDEDTREPDARFIAAARELVPQLLAERDSLRGVVQAAEALAEKWANDDEVTEWNPLSELRAALGSTRSEPRDEHWWAAKALMAICDNARTWQAGSGDEYDPLLVGVTEASHVVGRMVRAALAAAADAPQPEDLPLCEHGHPVSHYIDSKTAQYHQLDNICSGPSPAVLPEKPREACSTCGEPMDSLGCSKDPDDDRPRAIAGFHTIAGGCSVAEPVSGVAGNPDKDGNE